ncbi:MAG: hypothetical protein QMB38_08285, partial [Ascidiaceihabitans sp.]
RDVSEYSREDAKLFVHHLQMKGNKTATIRRRVNSVSAILNYAYSELDLDKRNPFTRLFIQNEGGDVFKRGTFSDEQLKYGYDKALSSGSTVKLLMPLIGETGCRLAEIVGFRVCDIELENALIQIRPNTARRLKTKNSVCTPPHFWVAPEGLSNKHKDNRMVSGFFHVTSGMACVGQTMRLLLSTSGQRKTSMV